MATMLMLALVAAMTTTTAAYATDPQETPNTDDANRWGTTTSGAAEEDGQTNIGEHSSDPDPGSEGRETSRSGLGNVGESLPDPFTTSSKRPSELAESLCRIDPNAAGC